MSDRYAYDPARVKPATLRALLDVNYRSFEVPGILQLALTELHADCRIRPPAEVALELARKLGCSSYGTSPGASARGIAFNLPDGVSPDEVLNLVVEFSYSAREHSGPTGAAAKESPKDIAAPGGATIDRTLAGPGVYHWRQVPMQLWEALGHELTHSDRYSNLRIELIVAVQAVLKAAHEPVPVPEATSNPCSVPEAEAARKPETCAWCDDSAMPVLFPREVPARTDWVCAPCLRARGVDPSAKPERHSCTCGASFPTAEELTLHQDECTRPVERPCGCEETEALRQQLKNAEGRYHQVVEINRANERSYQASTDQLKERIREAKKCIQGSTMIADSLARALIRILDGGG